MEDLITKINSDDFRTYLNQEFVRRSRSNASYSLRSFARDLSIDNSVMSKILSGKRKLGTKAIKNIVKRLSLNATQLRSLIKIENEDSYEGLAIDHFVVISEWYHYAILELMEVQDFKSDVKWIARALGIKVCESAAAIERLKRVEMIEEDEDGNFIDVSGGKTTNITDNMSHAALKEMQKQLLEKSIQSLEKDPYEKRSNTSMTFSIDPEMLPEAYEEIKKFRRTMMKFFNKGPKKREVYNLSIALCPLTKIGE